MVHTKNLEGLRIILTFKPLSGNRFRCNQTGIVTKQPKKYRHSFMKSLVKKVAPKRKRTPKKVEVEKEKRHWWE